ncbi:MAG: ribbon-helix-helix domain-containing protein [Leptospirales bacterium]
MRETITISLPEGIKAVLDEATKEEGLSRSELIREALREYLIVRRFRQLRQQMIPYAQNQGIHTDQDIFNRIS